MRVRTRRAEVGEYDAPLYRSMKARVGFGVYGELENILCPDCSTPEIVIDYSGEPEIKPNANFMLEDDPDDWHVVKIYHDLTCLRASQPRRKKTTR